MLGVSKKNIKMYYITEGTPEVDDIIYNRKYIGKLIENEKSLHQQNIKKTSNIDVVIL